MTHSGGCHCGAVRYEVTGEPQRVSICHCRDCQQSAGAPMVAWAAFADSEFAVTQGTPTTFNSSGTAMRSFCPACGSGLFYRNATELPGIVDIQSATFDHPETLLPNGHVQIAERLDWMTQAHTLPMFERYPPQ